MLHRLDGSRTFSSRQPSGPEHQITQRDYILFQSKNGGAGSITGAGVASHADRVDDQFGSISTELGCPGHVRFTPGSDRIADITESGFMEGTLVIPQFILRELQHIADSSDPLKRNRGRRGLDILQKIQKKVDIRVEISDMEFPEIREVDNKLVAMAKVIHAKIVTNDFNLNKVAELHGVGVLNINELTNALRPVVLPGEDMRVYVLKEGKEYNQGIAYLDDGTMVVVDSGRRHIGQTVDVCVTSVLQTTAGRMIFSRLKEEAEAA